MPWDKKTDQVLLSVGALEAWIQSKSGPGEYSYDKLWMKNFKSQAICIEWNKQMGVIAVGCDNGTLDILSFDPATPLTFEEVYSEKVHSGRIMSIHIDPIRNLIYTIGEDKYLKSTELRLREITSSCKVSSAKLTCLQVDTVNQIGYISDRKGNIFVYDLLNVIYL